MRLRIRTPDDFGSIRTTLEHHRGPVVVDAVISGEYLNPVAREIAEHLS
jgi:hypothetical protein